MIENICKECSNEKLCVRKLDTTVVYRYSKFLHNYEENITRVHAISHNSIKDILGSDVNFPIELFKKIDMLFTVWREWYDLVVSFFKYLILENKFCHHIEDIITNMIYEFYVERDPAYDFIVETAKKFMYSQLKAPEYDYSSVLNVITDMLINMYKISIVQYAQEAQLELGTNVLYFSPDFRVIDIELEKGIISYRMGQILNKHDSIDLRVITNDSTDKTKSMIHGVFSEHKHLILNYEEYL